MKLIWKIILGIISLFALLIIGLVIAFNVSEKPGVFVISKMFDNPVEITNEAAFAEVSAKVLSHKDVDYTSSVTREALDIYFPEDYEDKSLPVLFWVHGGAFVSGDKDAIEEFATYMVAENDIAVVAMNYGYAPEVRYPYQLNFVDDAYFYLKELSEMELTNNYSVYPNLDFSQVMFGGDSAGAQIAGQYVSLQTNLDYYSGLKIDYRERVDQDTIKAFISYSGPVDIEQLAKVESDSLFLKFFTNTVARAFIGKKDWKNSQEIKQASVAAYVTEDFPPTYITDGNTFSFQEQGLALAERLTSLGVPVESLFFNEIDKEIPHEYQFNYDLEESLENLQKTNDFIAEQLAK